MNISNKWNRVYAALLFLVMVSLSTLSCSPDSTNSSTNNNDTSDRNPPPTRSRGPGAYDLDNPSVGLDTLQSYSVTLSIQFDGTRGDSAYNWSESYQLDLMQDPLLYHYESSSEGLPEPDPPVVELIAGGLNYIVLPDGSCSAMVTDRDYESSMLSLPSWWLLPVFGAEEAGQETINDILTTHYTFDERAIGGEGISEASGEVWIAMDGGYIVRYHLAEQGPPNYFGEDAEGAMSWTYELTNANQPIEVGIPPGCPLGLVDAPLPPDAAITINQPGFLSYSLAPDQIDLIAFYQEQLGAATWEPVGEPVVTEGNIGMDFIRDNHQLSIQVSTDSIVTTVNIWFQVRPE